ncbi:MAG: FG-GAP-like repeat-containing protein [Phycisphaerales bacterium]
MATCAVVRGGTPGFTDWSQAAGIGTVQDLSQSPYPVGGHMFAGGAVGDFNGDGWQDLFVLSGGAGPDALYINDGDGTFTNRAAAWGLTAIHYGCGAAVGDYDSDGDVDIFVTSHGEVGEPLSTGGHMLYRNDGGQFTDVAAAAGVATTAPLIGDGLGAAFGDYDLDGDLDLAVAGWLINNRGNRLFRNNGDGTFTDATHALGYDMRFVHGFSPRFVDMNGDRYPELLWVADFRTSKYFINNGDGTFTEATEASGTGLDANGMGTTIGDFDLDGRLDWYVTSIFQDNEDDRVGNMLYMNVGDHVYEERGADARVNDGGWGWGTVAVDVDHDGDEDLVETNGWYSSEWTNEACRLFINQGNARFVDEAATYGLDDDGFGRGLVNMDFDNDGDQDIVVFNNGEAPVLFRNDLAPADRGWLRVFLETTGHSGLAPQGIGALVTARTGGVERIRYVEAGCNYLSVSETAAHFGLGAALVIDELEVAWPNGRRNVWRNLPANRTLTLSPCLLDGDADGDGQVDFNDLNRLLDAWGASVTPWRGGDVNGDGQVDASDLNRVLAGWGGDCSSSLPN